LHSLLARDRSDLDIDDGMPVELLSGEDCVYDNQRRQRGNEDKSSDLLIDPDGGASKEIGMVITRKQGSDGPLAHTRCGAWEA